MKSGVRWTALIVAVILIGLLAAADENCQGDLCPAPPASPEGSEARSNDPDESAPLPLGTPADFSLTPHHQSPLRFGPKAKNEDLKFAKEGNLAGILQYKVGDKEKQLDVTKYPAGTTFLRKEDGEIDIVLPDTLTKAQFDSVLQSGAGRLQFENPKAITNGPTLQGTFAIADGNLIVPTGTARVNNIDISATTSPVSVLFSTENVPKEGNIVAFGEKNFIAQGDGFSTKFANGNPYIKMRETDAFSITPQSGGRAELDTSKTDAPPELRVTGPAGKTDWATITNGPYTTTFGNNGIVKNSIVALQGSATSIPLKVRALDGGVGGSGPDLIRDKSGKPHFVLYDKDGSQFVLPEGTIVPADGLQYQCPKST